MLKDAEDSSFPLSVSLRKTDVFGNKIQKAKNLGTRPKHLVHISSQEKRLLTLMLLQQTDERLRSEMQGNRTLGLWPGLHKTRKSAMP